MHVRLFAYVLMSNHVHIVLQTPEANISKTIQFLSGRYAHTFNKRHGRHGHLFRNRFYSAVIASNPYLLEATRYVHLNPVRAGLATAPGDYPWSSYPYYVHPEIAQSLIDPRPVLELLARDQRISSAAYAQFVRDGMNVSDTSSV